jgi:hypothetical protein
MEAAASARGNTVRLDGKMIVVGHQRARALFAGAKNTAE